MKWIGVREVGNDYALGKPMLEPTFKIIAKNDYIAFSACVAIILMCLSFLIAFGLFWIVGLDKTFALVFLAFALVTVVCGLPLIVHRIKLIKRLFKQGMLVDARFGFLWVYSDHVRICYYYEFQENTFTGNFHVASLTYGQHFGWKDKQRILVDSQKPSRSILVDVFV